MDISFDLLINEKDLSKLNLSEFLLEWGGEFFHQEPPQYRLNTDFVFERFLDIDYYRKYHKKIIGDDFKIDEYLPLRLCGKHMIELENIVNNNEEIEKSCIIDFLHKVSMLDTYAIILLREEEYLDERYRVKTEKELIEAVCSCLNWDDPKGALITHL